MGKKFIDYIEISGAQHLQFHCPGCKAGHSIVVSRPTGRTGPIWTWNKDYSNPTVNPSIKVTYQLLSEAGRKRNREFHEKHGRHMTRKELPYDDQKICHSFIKNGKIEFLNDCTHKLKGQTVELQDEE